MIHSDLLAERARLTPENEALATLEPPARFTYRELDQRARRAAAALRRLGLSVGDRYAVLSANRVEFLDLFFAAPKLCATLVTIGTRLTAAEIGPIVEDSGARVVIYDPVFADRIAAVRDGDAAPQVEHWLALSDGDRAGEWDRLREAESAEGFEPAARNPEAVHCMLYTSGTTGRPKGVMIPQRQVAWNGYNTVASWGLRETDVSPIFTPLYHAGGLMAFLVPVFTAGGRMILHRGFDPEEIWATIEREGCTVILGVPTIWKILYDSPAREGVDLGRVRWLASGGAPLPAYLIEAYQELGVTFKQGFGMTEVGVNCFAMTAEESVRKRGSIGKPMMFTEVRLIDEDGRELPDGQVGEMCFRGPHVSLGYWNRPEETARSYQPDGWFRSGDLARRDEEGFYYVAGRAKDMIISGGVNIFPAEIESALLLHSSIEDAAVVGVGDEKWGEIGVAFVVEREGESVSDDELNEYLGARLARFKLPRAYRRLPELPRNDYGKVLKHQLAATWAEAEA